VNQLRHPSAGHKIEFVVGRFLDSEFVKIFHLSLLLVALAGVPDVVRGRCDSHHQFDGWSPDEYGAGLGSALSVPSASRAPISSTTSPQLLDSRADHQLKQRKQ
jgi:hypothetical protein